ncbi:MAG: NADH:flavin oxidoreductase [Spirochaetales bacterium]|nr:NADH:flavin oxidoreductase [Spirochaetales bacterium]
MPGLFEPTVIKSLSLANRFIRSATMEGMADDTGKPTDKLTSLYRELAVGGVGLIITGHTFVRRDGMAGKAQCGMHDDSLIPAYKVLTDDTHFTRGRIVCQLSHAGEFAVKKLTETEPLNVNTISENGIAKISEAYITAAVRAQKCGFDGVELHAAHGYFLCQFLSPLFNKRKDAYGDSAANRAKIVVNIIKGIKSQAGTDYPVLVKMNGSDFAEGGQTSENAAEAAVLFEEAGADALEISGDLLTNPAKGPSRKAINAPNKEAYFHIEANFIKQKTGIPIILVGGIRSFDIARELVESGRVDYIAMSRPFIRNPNLVNEWKEKGGGVSGCISDNLCFKPTIVGKGVYCVTLETLDRA